MPARVGRGCGWHREEEGTNLGPVTATLSQSCLPLPHSLSPLGLMPGPSSMLGGEKVPAGRTRPLPRESLGLWEQGYEWLEPYWDWHLRRTVQSLEMAPPGHTFWYHLAPSAIEALEKPPVSCIHTGRCHVHVPRRRWVTKALPRGATFLLKYWGAHQQQQRWEPVWGNVWQQRGPVEGGCSMVLQPGPGRRGRAGRSQCLQC